MLWDRERYLDHMTFHDTGRELFVELFGPVYYTHLDVYKRQVQSL